MKAGATLCAHAVRARVLVIFVEICGASAPFQLHLSVILPGGNELSRFPEVSRILPALSEHSIGACSCELFVRSRPVRFQSGTFIMW